MREQPRRTTGRALLCLGLRLLVHDCSLLRRVNGLSRGPTFDVEGTVEADELYHTTGNKGQAPQGGKKSLGRRARGRRKKRAPGRGHDDKDRPAFIAWGRRRAIVP